MTIHAKNFLQTVGAVEVPDATAQVRAWITGILDRQPCPAGDFLNELAQAACRADDANFAILLPAMERLRQKYPRELTTTKAGADAPRGNAGDERADSAATPDLVGKPATSVPPSVDRRGSIGALLDSHHATKLTGSTDEMAVEIMKKVYNPATEHDAAEWAAAREEEQ